MRREREGERKQHPLPAQKEPKSGEEEAKKKDGEQCVKYISRRKMYLFGREEEATAAAICRENERMRKVSVSDAGGGPWVQKLKRLLLQRLGHAAQTQQSDRLIRMTRYSSASMPTWASAKTSGNQQNNDIN